MSRILYAPGRYIQGAGAINEIGTSAARVGDCALVIGGNTALSLCGRDIEACLQKEAVACHQEAFGGVSSLGEIRRLTASAAGHGANIIIALGGGASIDAGKAVSHEMNLPVIVVPTTVATDAPCSALSVVYTDDGVFDHYLFLRRNPDCVIVDTAVIAQSPAKYLVAGMGDALACVWESDTCNRSSNPGLFCGGDRPAEAVLAMARRCYEILRESGVSAKAAVEHRMVTPAIEAVVEANILLSGFSSENGGHAGAHSIHNGLTTLPDVKSRLHGEKVAFGVLAQLVLEGRPEHIIREVQDFCFSVGLPLCLEDLGISRPSREQIRQVAEAAVAAGETIHATWFPVTATMVEEAIRAADSLGVNYKWENR
jgi:glycerol dehydrogenase